MWEWRLLIYRPVLLIPTLLRFCFSALYLHFQRPLKFDWFPQNSLNGGGRSIMRPVDCDANERDESWPGGALSWRSAGAEPRSWSMFGALMRLGFTLRLWWMERRDRPAELVSPARRGVALFFCVFTLMSLTGRTGVPPSNPNGGPSDRKGEAPGKENSRRRVREGGVAALKSN